MKRMLILLGILAVGVTGCTTNNFHYPQAQEVEKLEPEKPESVVEKRIPVEYYSKSTYIISREIIP